MGALFFSLRQDSIYPETKNQCEYGSCAKSSGSGRQTPPKAAAAVGKERERACKYNQPQGKGIVLQGLADFAARQCDTRPGHSTPGAVYAREKIERAGTESQLSR
jgi:hypothetical protein